jgi:hypothetical protein
MQALITTETEIRREKRTKQEEYLASEQEFRNVDADCQRTGRLPGIKQKQPPGRQPPAVHLVVIFTFSPYTTYIEKILFPCRFSNLSLWWIYPFWFPMNQKKGFLE